MVRMVRMRHVVGHVWWGIVGMMRKDWELMHRACGCFSVRAKQGHCTSSIKTKTT